MKYEKFIEICKNRAWDEMHLCGSFAPHFKIVMTAIYDVYHPNTEVKKRRGMTVWDDNLKSSPLDDFDRAYESYVNLTDFELAHRIAISTEASEPPGLADLKIAECIKNYVYAHKNILGKYLECSRLTSKYRDLLVSTFGDLVENKKSSCPEIINTLKNSGSPLHSHDSNKNTEENQVKSYLLRH